VIAGGIVAMFLASLLSAAVAEARAGSGFSGGSRGSRSYSAPRPSAPAPATPSSPTSPQRSLASPAQPARPGGFLGGWGSAIGGFLLGGLLGSLLFGGLGHGGFGLLELVLVAGLVYVGFMLFRRRTPEPALAGAPTARMGWTPAPETAEPPAATSVVGDLGLEEGIAAIRTMDRAFDPARVANLARDLFVRVQSAWSGRDLEPVRGELTDEMVTALESDLSRLRTLRRVNRIEQITVEAAEPTEAWQEYGRDFVTVRLAARAVDYTLDEGTGIVVDGSRTTPTVIEEFWTFTRPVGPQPWRLSAIQQPSA
jgi:predicted lipid-binding transport protein (Tim44 family)